MKNLKKALALLMASALAVSAAACNSQESQSGGNSGGDSGKPAEPTPLSLFVDESWWPYDTWKGAIPEEFNKRANVKIEVTRAADDKQLPLMVASGEMTDLVCTYRYQHMAKPDISYALDTLHEEYPDVDFPVHSVLQFVNTMEDGHYYTIGCNFAPESEIAKYKEFEVEGPGFFYRKDIAESLNLKFETLEDLDAAFAAVKQSNPEMVAAVFDNVHGFNWLRQQMGTPRGSYYEKEDGTLGWYLDAPGQADFYKKVNEWYRKGYILPDNFAYQTSDEVHQLAISGKAFSVFGYDNHADNFNAEAKASGADFTFQQQTTPLGNQAKEFVNNAGGRGVYITKSCKDVEAAYKTVAYMYGDEGMKLLMWGIEGEDYTLNKEGYPQFNYDFQGDNSVLEPRQLKYWGWLVHNEVVTGIADVTANSMTAQARMGTATIAVRNPVIGMIRFEADSEESIISTKIAEMVKSEEINIYMAESEAACEAAYEAMIQKANDLGMQKLVEYGNAQYPELAAEYEKIRANEE